MSRISAIRPSAWLATLAFIAMALPAAAVAPPTIKSFSPASAYEGEYGQKITIKGTNFNWTTKVTIGGRGASFDKVTSPLTITAYVPKSASTNRITVTTPGGTAYSATNFVVNPVPAPVVNSFKPASSFAGQIGKTITINGNYFKGTGRLTNLITKPVVKIGGTTAVVNSYSEKAIVATVPTKALYTIYPIQITTNGGTGQSTASFKILNAPAPIVSGFTPKTAYAGAAGQPVVITGSNFMGTGDTAGLISKPVVKIGGTVAYVQPGYDEDSITVTVPTNAIYTDYPIIVTTNCGTGQSATNFKIMAIPAPVISSFLPANGYTGEYQCEIKITGSNFMGTGFLTGMITKPVVTVGGTTAVVKNPYDESSITVLMPVSCAYTNYPITVTTNGGTATSKTNFLIKPIPAPVIDSISPLTGVVGDVITIKGHNFNGIGSLSQKKTGTSNITICGTDVVFTAADVADTEITVRVPKNPLYSDYWISVTNAGGKVWSTQKFVLKTIPAPIIDDLSTAYGKATDTITIYGKNLTGFTAVKFGGKVSPDVHYIGDTKITAVVPNDAKTGLVTVTTPGGTASSPGEFYVYQLPSISSFTPDKSKTGLDVTITGQYLTDAETVMFGGVTAEFDVKDANTIIATVPIDAITSKITAITGKITVITPGGTAQSLTDFTINEAPSISNITPDNGRIGDEVTITGTNFNGTPVVQINGTVVVSYTAVSATSITAVIPDGATTGTISVHTDDGDVTSAQAVTVYQLPTISGFTPTIGKVGDHMTITGANYDNVTAVVIGGVSINGVDFTIDSSTQISASVPAGVSSGKVSVTTLGGTATSAGDFTLQPAPTISPLVKTSGKIGASITITGTNFIDGMSVLFNGVEAVKHTPTSTTSIVVLVPSGASTGKVSVVTPGGTATTLTDFTVYQLPTITTITPNSGSVIDTVVSIVGTNLTDITSVYFGAVKQTAYTLSGDGSSIMTTVPAGTATGLVDVKVTTLGGTVISKKAFTVN